MTKTTALMLALAGLAWGQPATVTVSGPIYTPNGVAATGGIVTATLAASCVIGTTFIGRGPYTATIAADGTLSMALVPTASCVTAGNSYSVRYRAQRAGVPLIEYSETWTIPASPSTTTISAVRSAVVPSPLAAVSWTQLTAIPAAVSALTASVAANLVMAGPSSGAAAVPAFRALVAADIPASVIAADSVTNAMLAEMAASTIKGNNTGSTANPADMTVVQTKALLAYSAADLSNGVTGSGSVVLATSPVISGNLGVGIAGIAPLHGYRSGVNGSGPSAVAVLDSDAATASDAVVALFRGKNSAASVYGYGYLGYTITDPTAGSEDSTFDVLVSVAGSLSNKMSVSAAGITGTFLGNATTSTALAANPAACGSGLFVTDTDANGTLTCAAVLASDILAAVTSTEFGYLDGVTSAIQTQLDAKLSTATYNDPASFPSHKHYQVWESDGGGAAITCDESGNCGVANTSPIQKLDVNGNLLVFDKTASTGATKAMVKGGAGQLITDKLFDVQNNSGTSQFYVSLFNGNGGAVIGNGAGDALYWPDHSAMRMVATQILQWSATSNPAGSADIGVSRNSAGVLEVNNGTAGTYRDIQIRALLATANVTAPNIISTAIVRLKNYTVATLPAGTQGDTAFVTDALAPTFLATIVGGGAVVTPVFYNGSAWVGY